MDQHFLFNFNTDISGIEIPADLNNPFGSFVPEIAKIAAKEFEIFITTESKEWGDYFLTKGKMFGVLVVQKADGSFGYIGTASGKLPGRITCIHFVPSVFKDATDDFFINTGMTKITTINNQIKATESQEEIKVLKEKRRLHSMSLQQWIFENYQFTNRSGQVKNLFRIFDDASLGKPPSAAGECAAPKLLQYAFEQGLKPIAIAEFWWGNSLKYTDKIQNAFYPACRDRCKPILEFMLEDESLYDMAR